MQTFASLWLICALALLPGFGWAVETTLEVGYRLSHSDNSNRSSVDPISEWIQEPNATVTVNQEGPNISANGAYRFARRFYEENSRDEEPAHAGNANLTWHALPNRLDFIAENTTTLNTINSDRASSPENQQLTNTFSAGPTLLWRGFRPGDETRLNYRYVRTIYDRTNTDSVRQSTSIDYIVPLSQSRSLTTTLQYEDIDFDNDLSPDYEFVSGMLRYTASGDDLDINVSAGYKYIERADDFDDLEGFITDSSLTWKLSALSSLSFTYRRDADDRSTQTRRGIPEFGEEFRDSTDLNELFVYNEFTTTYSRRFGRTNFSLSGFYRDRDYEEDIESDEESWGGAFMVSRELTRSISARLRAAANRIDFVDENREDDIYRYDFELNWNAARRLRVALGTTYEDRESDNLGADYDEFVYYIGLYYMVLGPGR